MPSCRSPPSITGYDANLKTRPSRPAPGTAPRGVVLLPRFSPGPVHPPPPNVQQIGHAPTIAAWKGERGVARVGGDDLGQRVRGARHGGPWLRKCHEFETDLGAVAVRQRGIRRSRKIKMSRETRSYKCCCGVASHSRWHFPNDLGIRMACASQTWHLMLYDMIRGVLDRDAHAVDDLGRVHSWWCSGAKSAQHPGCIRV